MKPIRLIIQGFGPHKNTEIDFTNIPSPVALLAPYGTGKTTLIECMLFCLFGTGGWYTGSIYDLLTQNGTGEGKIEFWFEQNSEVLTAIRNVKTTSKTKSQTAMLQSDGGVIAGPKVTDFERAIVNLIGDYETFMATVFLSQNKKHDLIGNPGEPDLVARRRSVFNELIGASNLDKESEIAGNAAKENEAIIKELTAQLIDPYQLEEEKRNMQTVIESEKETLLNFKITLAQKQQDLDAQHKALRDIEGDDGVLNAQIQQYDTIKREHDNLFDRLKNLDEELNLLYQQSGKLAEAENNLAQYKSFLELRKEFEMKQEKFNAYKEFLSRQANLDNSIHAAEQSLNSIQGFTPDESVYELAKNLDEISARGKRVKEQNDIIAKLNAEKAIKRMKLQSSININSAEKGRLEKRLQNKPQTPGGDVCGTCPLLSEFSDIPTQIRAIENNIRETEGQLSTIPADEPIQDLAELRAEYERAKAAKDTVEKAEKAAVEFEKTKQRLESLKAQKETLVKSAPERVGDCSAEYKSCQQSIDMLSGSEIRVQNCKDAATKAQKAHAEIIKLGTRHKEVVAEMAKLKSLAETARQTLASREISREKIKADIKSLSDDIARLNADIDACNKTITRCETNIENLNSQIYENTKKSDRISALKETAENQRLLQKCFGSRGVRQILLDNAAPELEEIADELFQRATGGKFRLRISTQSVNHDGSLAEDFSILVTDERGEREATRYSGGQLQLIQIIFRIATAVWIGKIRGTKPDCLFIDEAFDRLGAEGTEDLLNLLDFMQESIGTIITVTHDPQIADRLPGQIRLIKEYGGVKVYINQPAMA